MRRLILLRHGEAEPAPVGGRDAERALTARGRADAAGAGRWLAGQRFEPEKALVSPARRARETWEAARAALPRTSSEAVRVLYNAQPDALLDAARDSGAESVLIVAHNPGLHALAMRLAAGEGTRAKIRAALADGLPPGGVVVFGLDARGELAGEALHLPSTDQEPIDE